MLLLHQPDAQEAAPRDGAETPNTPEVSPATTLALLQAEMDSVMTSMSDLVKVKDEDKITPYAKDRATLTSQFLLGKMQEDYVEAVDREVE